MQKIPNIIGIIHNTPLENRNCPSGVGFFFFLFFLVLYLFLFIVCFVPLLFKIYELYMLADSKKSQDDIDDHDCDFTW